MSHFNQAAADNAAISMLFERADDAVNALTLRMASTEAQLQTLRNSIKLLQAQIAVAIPGSTTGDQLQRIAQWRAHLQDELAQLNAQLTQGQASLFQDNIAVVAARCERFRYQRILEIRAERAALVGRRKEQKEQDVFAAMVWPRMSSPAMA